MKQLSNIPPKGTSDWFPEEYKIRKYIFDTWRQVCQSYGYQEYLTPIVETADIYRAKSGEDIGGKELMFFEDRAGRELAIRPEMTPSVTRMVTRFYNDTPKPIRLFSIANYFRNEKPQRGRNREFWQLNYDVFGSDSFNADLEVLQVGADIMLNFQELAENRSKQTFIINVNDREIINFVLQQEASLSDSEQITAVVRTLDKWEKLPKEKIAELLNKLGLNQDQIEALDKYMSCTSYQDLGEAFPKIIELPAFSSSKELIIQLETIDSRYKGLFQFQPSLIRGFDYYDGMIFEVFDLNPDNNRSLFGGGRYNGLASIFGVEKMPAVGCAPGDETTKLYLEGIGALPKILADQDTNYYIPLLSDKPEVSLAIQQLLRTLRQEGKQVEAGLDIIKFGKALSYADRKGIEKVIILAEDELEQGIYKVKDMKSGEEETFTL